MNSDGPGPPSNGGGGGTGDRNVMNGNISTDSAIAALEQHDHLFHRQVMHLRQQQVHTQLINDSNKFPWLILNFLRIKTKPD